MTERYVTPRSGTRQQWLAAHAIEISIAGAREHEPDNKVLVCLIDEGAFKRARIAIDNETRDVLVADDGITKRFFLTSRAALVSDGFL